MLHAFGFRGQEINITSSINLPSCERWITNKEFDWVHLQQCKDKNPRVPILTSPTDRSLIGALTTSLEENILTQS